MFEQPQTGESAVLVHIELSSKINQEEFQEFEELAASAGAIPAETVFVTRKVPEPKYFIGKGKAEEVKQAVTASHAHLVLVNHALSPAQERNLECYLQCRVLDRTGLILDIFAQRARTFEGKLQVELAQLQHLSTRLVRGWTHLERQKGGIGLRGPGETQLETDRRLVRARIKTITKRLEKVRGQRNQGRRARAKAAIPTVSLVGYTNAGKSTLFNYLTHADVTAESKLFATLDPTLRRVHIPGFGPVVLVDTVGFIRHLPHDLVSAFRATLEETSDADLLLHVIDAHDPRRKAQMEQVHQVLEEIHASQIPQIKVYNKVDLIPSEAQVCEKHSGASMVRLSARTGEGIDALFAAITSCLSKSLIKRVVKISPNQHDVRAKLYDKGYVIAERADDNGACYLLVNISKLEYDRWFR